MENKVLILLRLPINFYGNFLMVVRNDVLVLIAHSFCLYLAQKIRANQGRIKVGCKNQNTAKTAEQMDKNASVLSIRYLFD